MITYKDQMNLFKLISKRLKKNLKCYAFGGTAMMFYGYKDDTKDIDLLFEDNSARLEFIQAIKDLGFEETSLFQVYIIKKQKDPHRPLMFKRDDFRFDLFVSKIFRTKLSPKMKENLFAIHEFKDKYTFRVNVIAKEHIVQLKAITERQNDFDDIKLIMSKEKDFNWQYMIDEVIWQDKNGDDWAILDTEKMMQELKEYTLIEEKYFKQLYKKK